MPADPRRSIRAVDDPWSAPETVAGFARSAPNAVLMRYAEDELRRLGGGGRALDLGCGAGRNAVPLASLGWEVVGTDLSSPMLRAAAERAERDGVGERVRWALAPMDALPFGPQAFDLVIAHGVWNLARSGEEHRRAVAEAARVARPGAALFVFTFSRNTLPAEAQPVPGESFVFTQFSGRPQCFLTEEQLFGHMREAGFEPDRAVPLTEYNRPQPGTIGPGTLPVIYEASFRRRRSDERTLVAPRW